VEPPSVTQKDDPFGRPEGARIACEGIVSKMKMKNKK
jgi:hypothetical protein